MVGDSRAELHARGSTIAIVGAIVPPLIIGLLLVTLPPYGPAIEGLTFGIA